MLQHTRTDFHFRAKLPCDTLAPAYDSVRNTASGSLTMGTDLIGRVRSDVIVGRNISTEALCLQLM